MEVYLQTTEYTCAASALLMIVHHFNRDVPLNREYEFIFWHRTANLPVRASSIYALAVVAKEFGLNPRIVLEEKEYDYPDYRFKRYTKKEIDEAKFSSRIHAKRARELGIPIVEQVITIDDVLKELSDGKILLLRVNAGIFRDTRSTSKYVVVFKDGSDLVIVDPKKGRKVVSVSELEEAMVTLQTKKKRDVRMIVFD